MTNPESPDYAALIARMCAGENIRPSEVVFALRTLLKERDTPCKTCGNDPVVAKIGEMLGFRPDLMLMEIKSLQSKLEQYESIVDQFLDKMEPLEVLIEAVKVRRRERIRKL